MSKINEEEKATPKTWVVERDNEPAIKFIGTPLAVVSSKSTNGSSSTRWTVLKLYQTESGKFICAEIGKTLWQGERDLYRGKICDSMKQAIDFFGHGWLAKELYDEADIDTAIDLTKESEFKWTVINQSSGFEICEMPMQDGFTLKNKYLGDDDEEKQERLHMNEEEAFRLYSYLKSYFKNHPEYQS